jgi:hypothetical protein
MATQQQTTSLKAMKADEVAKVSSHSVDLCRARSPI